jgi:hypothetical protein
VAAITLGIRNRKKKAEKVKKIKKIGDKYQIEPIKGISKNEYKENERERINCNNTNKGDDYI